MITIRHRKSASFARVAVLTAVCLATYPVAPLLQAQGAQKPAQAAASPQPPDGGWPRAYTTNAGGALVLYQPQVSSWADQKHLVMYAAVSYQAKGAKQPAFGTLKVESNSKVSVEHRVVSFSDFAITESNFSTLKKEQVADILTEVKESVNLDERVLGLDRVLAQVDTSQILPKNAEGLKADPPTVFFSKTPAVLVNIDGDPIWSAIQGNDLRYAINTNWDLFEHTPTKTCYLLVEDAWLKATDIEGPWAYAGPLPASFSKLPADDNWKDVKAALPGKKLKPEQTPKAFLSLVPAEMILLQGEPKYVPVTTGSQLLWVSNTDADVFRMGQTGPVYYLVSGRWFSAPDFTGPWTFATPNMPEEFRKIPLEHARSRVLASVPGTTQAAEAVLVAQIPQTARVGRNTQAPEVKYQGDPQFQAIPNTTVARAVNTDKDILKVGDLYYMCFQGVWFMSKSPAGPWEVCSNVPKPIYEIPPSSPSYNVTYVTVQESNNDAVVFATAMAFTGLMIAWGCAVWGTGYYYPPYVYRGPYPVYYPHYPTYGYAAAYNPWTGSYGRAAVAYGPYGGAGVGAKYNPTTGRYTRSVAAYGPYGGAKATQGYNARTGTYSRSAVAYGPYGAQGAAQAYNPRTGAYGETRQGSNVYGSWGSTTVQRGDDWATTSRYTNKTTGATTRTTRTSEGGSAASRSGAAGRTSVGQSGSGDVYAGHNGNVYKKTDGGWQQYDNGNWNNVEQPQRAQGQSTGTQSRPQTGTTGTTGTQARPQAGTTGTAGASSWSGQTASQVQRDASARATGAERTRDYGSVQRGSGNAGSYKPTASSRSGGASRSGGGSRRR